MPRVSNAPRARVFSGSGSASTPAKSPVKIPLNDDRREKANRLHSRQAQHEIQMNQIKAAATPLRKRRSLLGQSPRTPGDNGEDELPSVSGTAVTPMKRVPIMANFEEWMKMATDNKINATNSWNFALIDYFHDMSLLKEGDGVNFQRASCTLDGCVKIYTNRVDSVATETGKLLSGLADGNNKKRQGNGGEEGEEDEDEDGEEEGEDGVKKRTKKRTQRSSEATLATSFAQLQLKKMELEFAVDPLFKKASADFDEGGAKGLLLNHLAIDGNGRIVFGSSDDSQDAAAAESDKAYADELEQEEVETDAPTKEDEPVKIEIGDLAAKFFPDLSILDDQDVCPSLKAFELGDASGSLDLPFLKAPEDWKQEGSDSRGNSQSENPAIFSDEANAGAFEDDDNLLDGLDLLGDVGFGQGGEVWARDAALEPQMRVHGVAMAGANPSGDDGMDEAGDFESHGPNYTVTIRHGKEEEQENILNYFDKALQKNWAGPEHWKIRRVKDAAKSAVAGPAKRKEKEPFEIDFTATMSQALADALYTPAASASSISLPKVQWKSKSRNLLPDDKHFNSRQLLRLFLKPKASIGTRRQGDSSQQDRRRGNPDGEVDEQFWASKDAARQDEGDLQGNYDADFFQDDAFGGAGGIDDDDDEFADAQDHLSPPLEDKREGAALADGGPAATQGVQFGTQLITQSRRMRPEYVQYARVAKKVDVRRLKEEIWRGLALDETQQVVDEPTKKAVDDTLMFTDVINGLQAVYPKQTMADISTSFCFICLLHLANEKGLVISNRDDFQDLAIRKDPTAEIVSGAD